MKVNIAILTVTDTRTIDNDKSGAILVKKIAEQNHKLVDRKIVKDEKEDIKKIILEWTRSNEIDVIITTGGTGLTGRDITPEVLDEIADKKIKLSNSWYLYLTVKSLCNFKKWQICVCTSWIFWWSNRCVGNDIKISIRYKS